MSPVEVVHANAEEKMKILKITESHGQVVVETSAGIRTSGASVTSALRKLFVIEDATPGSFTAVEKIFATIPDPPASPPR